MGIRLFVESVVAFVCGITPFLVWSWIINHRRRTANRECLARVDAMRKSWEERAAQIEAEGDLRIAAMKERITAFKEQHGH